MDAITTPVTRRLDPPARHARPLWATPLFVVGVGVLAWVLLVRPFLNSPERRAGRDLDGARQLLEKPEGDSVEAAKLLNAHWNIQNTWLGGAVKRNSSSGGRWPDKPNRDRRSRHPTCGPRPCTI